MPSRWHKEPGSGRTSAIKREWRQSEQPLGVEFAPPTEQPYAGSTQKNAKLDSLRQRKHENKKKPNRQKKPANAIRTTPGLA